MLKNPKKSLDPDPDAEDFQNLTSSSLSTDTSCKIVMIANRQIDKPTLGRTTGAVLGRQNTSSDNLPPNMTANDFLQWNATLQSCSNSRARNSSQEFW